MDAKALIKQMTPPFILELYRRARGKYIWKGIYRSFAAVPSQGAGFENADYVRFTLAHARRVIGAAGQRSAVPTEVFGDDAFLPLLVSVMRRPAERPLRIVDFGGGLGTSRVYVLSSAVGCAALDYHVVELEWACREGPRLFPGDRDITFHRSLPAALQDVDIVYTSGVLMFVDDYAALLKRLCAYRARYLLITNVAAGRFATFASTQVNFDRSGVAHWFFNYEELVELAQKENYRLIFKSAVEPSYNLENFPPEYRLDGGRNCALLFANADA